jgi:hypothetical protein
MTLAVLGARRIRRKIAMAVRDNSEPPAEPAPCVASEESIRKAQALREALRAKLLNRPELPANPYWVVGAD